MLFLYVHLFDFAMLSGHNIPQQIGKSKHILQSGKCSDKSIDGSMTVSFLINVLIWHLLFAIQVFHLSDINSQ